MRGYVDTTASEIRHGDTVIDPVSGVLASVESVEPVNEKGIVVIHMRGSVSLGYMGISAKPDRPLRRAPRAGDAPVAVNGIDDYLATGTIVNQQTKLANRCACGHQSRDACARSCIKG